MAGQGFKLWFDFTAVTQDPRPHTVLSLQVLASSSHMQFQHIFKAVAERRGLALWALLTHIRPDFADICYGVWVLEINDSILR